MDALTHAQVVNAFEILQAIGAGPRSHLAIIGGMVPTLRTVDCDRPPATGHAGTTDVDIVVELVMAAGATADYYRGLTEALRACGLRPESETDPPGPGWRWTGRRHDARVVVELLSEPTYNTAAGRTQTLHNTGERDGDDEIDLLAMPHSQLAIHDRRVIELELELEEGTRPDASFPVAGLGSWLVLKRFAAEMRGGGPTDHGRPRGKDYYDVAWMLMCLGVDGSARELAASPLLEDEQREASLREALQWLHAQFDDPNNFGPGCYVTHLRHDGHDVDEATARRDARHAVCDAIDASGLLLPPVRADSGSDPGSA